MSFHLYEGSSHFAILSVCLHLTWDEDAAVENECSTYWRLAHLMTWFKDAKCLMAKPLETLLVMPTYFVDRLLLPKGLILAGFE